jgi:hypothetical protein
MTTMQGSSSNSRDKILLGHDSESTAQLLPHSRSTARKANSPSIVKLNPPFASSTRRLSDGRRTCTFPFGLIMCLYCYYCCLQ